MILKNKIKNYYKKKINYITPKIKEEKIPLYC